MKLLRALLAFFDRLAFWAIALLMGAMGVVAFMAVVYRSVLHDPIRWSEEAARYMMAWVTFLGAGYAMGKGRHIGVAMFVERLPEAVRRKVTWGAEVVVMAFLAVVTVQGVRFIISLWGQTSPAMDIPMGLPYLAIPVGGVYMFLHLLALVMGRSSMALSIADLELEEALKGKGAGEG